MHPFASIWIRPRQTIRAIVDHDPRHLVLPLYAGIGAVSIVMQTVKFRPPGGIPSLLVFVAVASVVGAVVGFAGLYVFGWLYRWVGSWFGGRATNVEVRAVLAWTATPTFVLFAVWAVCCALFPGWAGARIDRFEISAPFLLPSLFFGLVSLVIGIWQLVLKCQGLGEVHRFSAWKGLGTVVIPNLIIFLPIAVLALVAAIAIPNVLRARITTNDAAAVGNLRALTSSLEMYRSAHSSYPTEWYELYPVGQPALGPPAFQTRGPYLTEQPVQGHAYTYATHAGGGYQIVAVPVEVRITGFRSFYIDETGRVHHCIPGEDGLAPSVDDVLLEKAPRPCGAGTAHDPATRQ